MKPFTKIFKKIEKYDTIAVFRHVSPDYDALGSQFGLVTFLKDNYPNKKIYALGKDHGTFTGKLFPKCDVVSDEELFAKPFLAIVLDTGNSDRVEDKRFEKGDFIIKIDHHPTEDIFANFQLVQTDYCATSEILLDLFYSPVFKAKTVSKEAAKYLYTALVGDSGRFQYSSVTSRTLMLASKLFDTGFDFVHEVYAPMYSRKLADLKVTGYLLNHFTVTPKGVGYFHISNQDMINLGINLEKCKENVNLLANIEEIKIWVNFYEDVTKNLWRVSIRSRDYVINKVAAQYKGGGHDYAAGAQVADYDESLRLIEDLDALIEE
jgi:phosphoesterase RecJ-like protein